MDVSPGLVTGTYNTLRPEIDCHSLDVSALGENFDATPMVLPIRGCLDSVKRLLKGDLYIGRGSRQRSLAKSRNCNTFKVSEVGREMAIERFRETLKQDQVLYCSLWTLSGRRLISHCRLHEKCHGDVLIQEFSNSYPQAFDRTTKAGIPADSRVLNYMSRLREEPDSEEGSSTDEGVPEKGSGHCGIGPPLMVGVGYTQRELCDGQSLASPRRWPPGSRVYPASQPGIQIAECYARSADHRGTETLLVSLASGKVTECPFPAERNQDAQVASPFSPEEEVAAGIPVRSFGLLGRFY